MRWSPGRRVKLHILASGFKAMCLAVISGKIVHHLFQTWALIGMWWMQVCAVSVIVSVAYFIGMIHLQTNRTIRVLFILPFGKFCLNHSQTTYRAFYKRTLFQKPLRAAMYIGSYLVWRHVNPNGVIISERIYTLYIRYDNLHKKLYFS